MNGHDDSDVDFEEGPSKSQRKREMHALRDLGERITKLPRAQRDGLPKSEALTKALAEFDRIRSREARRRHLSFIGKVLRSEDLTELQAALERLDASSSAHTRTLHALESWREALIESDAGLDAFLGHWPHTDRPRLRNAVRAARREAEQAEPARRHFRALFTLLRDETGAADADELPLPP